jgi:hypothetical protein
MRAEVHNMLTRASILTIERIVFVGLDDTTRTTMAGAQLAGPAVAVFKWRW